MKKATKRTRRISLFFALLGVVFFALGAAAYGFQDRLINFVPRHDLAFVGFFVLGGAYVIISLALICLASNHEAMTEEADERLRSISGIAGQLAYGIQTVVLFTAGILMTFAGYIDAFGLFVVDLALVTGVLSYCLLNWYFRRKM